MSRLSIFLILCLGGTCFPNAGLCDNQPLFYKAQDYGSEAQFNPVSSFLNYSFDTLQISDSFSDDDLDNKLQKVFDNLGDPFHAISREGSYHDFINRQILPIDFDNLDDSLEMLPNYTLHMIGGGMVYRKNVEWFEQHDFPFPKTISFVLGMSAEILQEAVEKESTSSDDEVADVYIFRPIGMLLFSSDGVARFFAEKLRMVEWPYQPMYNLDRGEFANIAESFAIRPNIFDSEQHLAFLFFGSTTLLGASHAINQQDRLSWGIGAATEEATRDDVQLRLSGGLFYDRQDSLLSSLIVNGTENLLLRLNVYPGVLGDGVFSPGVFLGLDDDENLALGLTIAPLPLGISELFE